MKFLYNGKETNRNLGDLLSGPLSYLKRHCKEKFTILINPISKTKRIGYYLEHRKSKTLVSIERDNNEAIVKAYRTSLPDIKTRVVPIHECLGEQTFSVEDDDYGKLVGNILLQHLGYQTIYYKGIYPENKVAITLSPSKEYACYGGKIIDLFTEKDQVILIIENGLQYALPKDALDNPELKQYNYFIMKHDSTYGILNAIDFNNIFLTV